MSRSRTCLAALSFFLFAASSLAGQSVTGDAAAEKTPKIDFSLGAGSPVVISEGGIFLYPFGQAAIGGLPEKGPGFRLGAMGTVGPGWHHDFVLVATLDLIGKVGRSNDASYYVFGGPCALVSPMLGVWFDGGIGASGILDTQRRSALYGEARFVPIFGYDYFNVMIIVSAGIRFNF